jgi:lipoate-protein ligase B
MVDLVEKMRNFPSPPLLILLEHPPVTTIGKGSKWEGFSPYPIYRVERGGDVTVHAPGGVVGYTIVHLKREKIGVHKFVFETLGVLVDLLREYSVPAYILPSRPGVYTPRGKIASIGVAIQRGVSFHGFALYLKDQKIWFSGIPPCGYSSLIPDHLTFYLDIPKEKVVKDLGKKFFERWGYKNFTYREEEGPPPLDSSLKGSLLPEKESLSYQGNPPI